MAKQYVSGPGHLYVGVDITPGRRTASQNTSVTAVKRPIYLGTAEKFPKITKRPNFKPTFVDQGGEVPHDVAFMGEEAFVAADLSRYNEAVYNSLSSRPRHQFGLRGFTGSQDIGTLMIAEGKAYPLWVHFPYASKAAFSDMPNGYHFFASYLIGPDELEPLGTTPRKVRLIWHCLRVYDPVAGNYLSYDHDMTGLPGPD